MKKSCIPIVLIAIIALILLVHVNYLRFVCDDAFISFRYAKNFVEGHGLVYNIGERVEGYTNFLWTLLLSLFMNMGLDPVTMSQVLGILFSLATVFLLLRLNRRLYPDGSMFNYLAPLFLACCGAYAAWSTGGLETSLFTFLVLLGSYLLIARVGNPKFLACSGIVFALACMTRLDGLILASVTFGFLLYLVVSVKKVEVKGLLLWSLFLLIPFLLYFVWRWSYYGKMLPNTFYIKVAGAAYCQQGFSYLLSFIERFWIWLMVVPLFFLGKGMKLNTKLRMVVLYFTSMILVFSCYVVYVGGDFMDMFRFFVPILPFFFFLIQEGLRGLHGLGSAGRAQTAPWLVGLEIFVAALMVFLLAYPSRQANEIWSKRGIDSVGLLRGSTRVWTIVGETLKMAGKPEESLATTAAGAIPYYSGMYAIDQLGLTLADLSHLRPRKSARPGHQREVTSEFLLSRRPTYIIGHPILVSRTEIAGGALLSESEMVYLQSGYEVRLLKVEVSEREDKYLYCLTWKGIESRTDAPLE